MAFVEVAANSDSGAYQVSNSLRFDDGSSCKLEFDTSGDGTATKGTISLWVKRSSLDIMSNGSDALVYAVNDSENYSFLRFDDADKLDFYNITSNTLRQRFVTTRVFRDIAAWYHIVLAFDVSQASSSDGIKIYVNGVLETDFGTSTYNQNQATNFFLANADWKIGVDASGGSFFDGYMANVEAITNQQLTATDFGKFNDNGVWVPKAQGHTAGTNGFKLEFKQTGTSANASGMGADTSGNDNHFTPTNLAAIDVTTDTPTNNFATLNPLMGGRGSTLSEGNCKVSDESDNNYDVSTFGSSMKFYFEWKLDEAHSGGNGIKLSVMHEDEMAINDNYGNFQTKYVKTYTNSNDGKYQDGNGQNPSGGGSLTRATLNDIIMVACDGGNGKVWFGVNGTWLSSGDPANGTGGFHGSWSAAMETGIYFACPIYSVTNGAGQINFGNPSFSISSGNSDANGYGNFEYAVPGGFYALCTKNLAEYG